MNRLTGKGGFAVYPRSIRSARVAWQPLTLSGGPAGMAGQEGGAEQSLAVLPPPPPLPPAEAPRVLMPIAPARPGNDLGAPSPPAVAPLPRPKLCSVDATAWPHRHPNGSQ